MFKFQWHRVASGLAVMVLAGGAAAVIIMTTGTVRRGTAALVIVAFGGLFTAISGLMGEEGIW